VYLIKQWGRGKVIIDYLRIRNIAGVVEHEPATNAYHPAGKHLLAQAPPGRIDLVDTLVA